MKERVVYVRWVDSTSGFGWLDRGDWTGTEETSYCHTVGYLIAETDHNLVVAHTIDPDSNNVNSPMEIPLSAVREVVDLVRKAASPIVPERNFDE